MLSRKLLVSGASMVVLTLGALGGATGSASASAGAMAGSHHVGTSVHTGNLRWSGIRPHTMFLGHLVNRASGLCLGVSHGAVDGDAVQAGCVNHPDQEWTAGDPFANGFYRIYNGYGQCLGVSAGETRDGAQVVATQCLGGHDDQLWEFIGTSPQCDAPFYAPIFNDKATGKVIGVAGGSTATSAPIVIWTFQAQPCNNQYWGTTGN